MNAIFRFAHTCCVYVIVLVAAVSVAQASDSLRLTMEGQLLIDDFPIAPDPPLDEVLGLQVGDPVVLTFEFDSTIPPDGRLNLQKVEADIGVLNFQPERLMNVLVRALPTGNSGISFNVLFITFQESSQNHINLLPISALPLLIDFETGDIGADPNSFPADLSFADISVFQSGVLGLVEDENIGDVISSSNFLRIDLTNVTVTAIPDVLLGDVNCDGVVDLLDVVPFVAAIADGEFLEKADINQDGELNLLDVGPFVDLLSN